MNNKKIGLIISTLALGLPIATTLLPTQKSEAVLKGAVGGALKTATTLSKIPTIKPLKSGSLITTKIRSLSTSPAVKNNPSTSTTVTTGGKNIQALISGLNKGLTGSSSSSSTPSSAGKLNLNSEFRNKLSGILGSGNPNFASNKSPLKNQNSNVGKLSATVTQNLGSILGGKGTSTQSSNQSSGGVYVNPNAPSAPSLTPIPTTSTPAAIPDAPPLPPVKQSSQIIKPVITKSSSSSTSSLKPVKTTTKPSSTPTGYDNMLNELKTKLNKK